MKSKERLQKAAFIAYIVVGVSFLLTFVYMLFFEKASVYAARGEDTYTVIEDYQVKDVKDDDAPVGVRTEYTFTLHDLDASKSCLGFYLVHQYAEVYFDDELIYRLVPDEHNTITKGVSSNWIMVPVFLEDSGKEVTVIVTPIYKSAINYRFDFRLGSRYAIFISQLKADLLQIVLAALCILLGIVIMSVGLGYAFTKKNNLHYIFYLGNLSALLGIWKITDTRFSSLMFYGNPLVLGYIAIGMLFIVCIPLMFFIRNRLQGNHVLFPLMAILFSAVAEAALICQVFGLAEFRETLPAAHVMIILSIVLLMGAVFLKKRENGKKVAIWSHTILLFVAAFADVVSYYVQGTSSGILYTIIAFLIYTVSMFVVSLSEMNKKVYTDAQTGLFNRNRWDELMKDKTPVKESIGIVMFDLNRLKYTNDTLGHDAGDKMILGFTNILRNSIPQSNTICRWGGDEFAVLLLDATKERVEEYLQRIETATDVYNNSGAKPEIHYSAGYALSDELPGLSRLELLKVADGRMYQNKQKWYDENVKVPVE